MTKNPFSQLRNHPLILGAAAGLVANAAAGLSDRLLDRLVSDSQKRRDNRLREGPAHQTAGPFLTRKITGIRLSEEGKKRAQVAFSTAYGIGWGMAYATLRRKVPQVSRWAGMSFAVPFFLACDGLIAPLLRVSPGLGRIPWQPSAKEMGNHMAWTATAEMIHRAAQRRRSAGA